MPCTLREIILRHGSGHAGCCQKFSFADVLAVMQACCCTVEAIHAFNRGVLILEGKRMGKPFGIDEEVITPVNKAKQAALYFKRAIAMGDALTLGAALVKLGALVRNGELLEKRFGIEQEMITRWNQARHADLYFERARKMQVDPEVVQGVVKLAWRELTPDMITIVKTTPHRFKANITDRAQLSKNPEAGIVTKVGKRHFIGPPHHQSDEYREASDIADLSTCFEMFKKMLVPEGEGLKLQKFLEYLRKRMFFSSDIKWPLEGIISWIKQTRILFDVVPHRCTCALELVRVFQ